MVYGCATQAHITVESEQPESEVASRRNTALVVGVSLALVTGFFLPIPDPGPTGDIILDSAHVVVFALFSYFLMQGLRRYLSIGIRGFASALISTAVGVGIEFIQPMFGRKPSMHDVWADMWGAIAGVMIAMVIISKDPITRIGYILLALAFAALGELGVIRL